MTPLRSTRRPDRVAPTRSLRRIAALVSAAGLALAIPVLGQESITSDRPGIGSGSAVLDDDVLQFETGLSVADAAGERAYSFGQLLVRLGYKGVELEGFFNSYVVRRGDTPLVPDADGFQDLGVGLKVPVVSDPDAGYALSVQGILTFPTGASAFTADDWTNAVNLLVDVPIGGRAGLSVNLGQSRVGESGRPTTYVVVTPGVSLAEGWGVYGGWAGFFGSGADTHFAEGGLTFTPTPDVQLDVNGGWDVDRDDWFFGVGIAARRMPG